MESVLTKKRKGRILDKLYFLKKSNIRYLFNGKMGLMIIFVIS